MSYSKSCFLAFVALSAWGVAGAQGTAFVNFGSAAQTIRGFGGATAWMPQLSSAQANALFSNGNSQQIGLSILRVRIDPAGSGNWGTELANAQAAHDTSAARRQKCLKVSDGSGQVGLSTQ